MMNFAITGSRFSKIYFSRRCFSFFIIFSGKPIYIFIAFSDVYICFFYLKISSFFFSLSCFIFWVSPRDKVLNMLNFTKVFFSVSGIFFFKLLF